MLNLSLTKNNLKDLYQSDFKAAVVSVADELPQNIP